eukprot:TRINITY_DN3847_c0_g1_i1.p1 TRINITY_DN3847_c0_g1~~TRINITY_DN3847_c0_g1_i1.p1  ORF type:complete len:694 (-),score=169.68 TRINITY_DN3847_c0_g1_i1:610-2691(-)
MAEVVYTYLRQRKEFGRAPEFQDAEPEVLIDIFPKQDLRDSYVPLDPYETDHQCAPELAEAWTNTESRTLASHGITHLEGGWPLGVDPTEIESKIKYTRKAERDEGYVEACKRLIEPVEDTLKQNNAIDIYELYFTDPLYGGQGSLSTQKGTGDGPGGSSASAPGSGGGGGISGGSGGTAGGSAGGPGASVAGGGGTTADLVGGEGLGFLDAPAPAAARTRTVLSDPSPFRRAACYASWQGERRLAVAYSMGRSYAIGASSSAAAAAIATSVGTSAAVPAGSDNSSSGTHHAEAHVFDLANPNAPELDVRSSSAVTCIQFNPKDVHLLAGGSQTGVVQIWDTRKPPQPVAESAVEHAHRGQVTDLRWLMSKSGEVLTTSTDGRVMVWDVKKMDRPIEGETVVIQSRSNEAGPKGAMGGLCLDYDPLVGGPSKYMVGTEHGVTFSCNRRGKSATERIIASYAGHHGPVYAVMRNPMFPKTFLTAGDWRVHLWSDDLRLPVVSTPYCDAYLTGASWHPVRPGVFMTSRSDGLVDVWDLVHRQTQPAVSVRVSDSPLTMVRPQAEGRLVAACATDGAVSLLQLSDGLVEAQRDEKALVGAMFERETQRDKALAQRAKELRSRGRRKVSLSAQKPEAPVDEVALGDLADQYLQAVKSAEEEQLRQEKARRELREQRLAQIDAETGALDSAPAGAASQ